VTDRPWHPDADVVLARLVPLLHAAVANELLGLYAFGSAVTGDFEPGVSDVDLVAVLAEDPRASVVDDLAEVHRRLVEELPAWNDRIEVVYVSSRALAGFRERSWPAARISPGEAFHAVTVDPSWVLDWYRVRELDVPVLGPPATEIIPPISNDEYRNAVRTHLLAWPPTADAHPTRGSQAYAILTMCRGLMTLRTDRYSSKREAARWAAAELPSHAPLIADAVRWRELARHDGDIDGAATLGATIAFVRSVQRLVASGD